ncbi:NAD(P)-dependent oxidoreductase [Pradoshia sp.]
MSITEKNILDNFKEVYQGLSHQEAAEESARCLYCYDAPCIQACPTSINVPSFIKKISSNNLRGAAKTIMTANPMGASCARVCPTEELCEGACVLNHSTKPIMIGNLQRYATDWAMKNEQLLFKAGQPNGKSVAIIGGGPAGLSAARELSLLGYRVVVFEAEEKAGGLNTYGIVSFRLPQAVSFWEVDQVKGLGVEIRTNTRVGVDVKAEEILENFDYTLLAAGMSHVPNLGITGEELDGVHDAIEFVKETKKSLEQCDLRGKKAVVIGAGNTAIDAATCSVRLGAENVKILYRRTKEEMTAYEFEYEFAKQDGVEFRWLTAPVRILSNEEGKVSGVECIRIELGQAGDDGRQRPIPVQGSNFVIEADVVIKAIGQSRHTSLIEQFNVKHEDGVAIIDPLTYRTSNEKVSACGDCIFGKGQGEAMVVSAAQQGKEAAYAIHRLLSPAKSVTA